MLIGIDFDNTIAGYDALFGALAVEHGLFEDAPGGKRQVRDELRRRDGGEEAWRRLQGLAYGSRMDGAALIDGADRFLHACRHSELDVCIVSHKTRYANFEPDGTDLRKAALLWLKTNAFFDDGGFAMCPDQVFFEDTRAAKVARIESLGCDAFIDDLEEVFCEPGYPDETRKILFDPHGTAMAQGDVTQCRHWDEITHVLLGHANTDG